MIPRLSVDHFNLRYKEQKYQGEIVSSFVGACHAQEALPPLPDPTCQSHPQNGHQQQSRNQPQMLTAQICVSLITPAGGNDSIVNMTHIYLPIGSCPQTTVIRGVACDSYREHWRPGPTLCGGRRGCLVGVNQTIRRGPKPYAANIMCRERRLWDYYGGKEAGELAAVCACVRVRARALLVAECNRS